MIDPQATALMRSNRQWGSRLTLRASPLHGRQCRRSAATGDQASGGARDWNAGRRGATNEAAP
jgi:hypothetical protein